MKKILATILALTMVLSLGVSAFATGSVGTDSDTVDGSDSQEVKVTVTKSDDNDTYKVEVNWGSLTYTYHLQDRKWNTTSHDWELDAGDVGEAKWEGSATAPEKEIQVTNHSSQAVDIEFAYADAGTLAGTTFTGTFSAGTGTFIGGNTLQLASADDSDPGNNQPKTGSVKFQLDGTPTESMNETTVGTITLTVKTGSI